MLIGDNTRTKNVHGLSTTDLQRIKDFLQGAVYCWCKNRKGEWFNARDFLGGDNFYWEHYPLGVLYFRQLHAGKTHDEAFEQAAKDAGHILKKMLQEDDRTFETQGGYTRSYLWTGE
jgi:hypothetical protein